MRVLLIAESANPEWVSVPLEGWSHSRAIAGLCDTHVVTQIRNRAAFERAGLAHGRDFTAIDSERVTRPLAWTAYRICGGKGKGWTTITAFSALGYYYFERLVWRQFGNRIRAGEFDIVHRLTPLSPTAPSLLATWCRRAGVPFVMGPLNGGLPWPAAFDAARRKEREWLSYVRGAYRLLPGYRSTRRDASAIIVGSRATAEQMPDAVADKCVYIPENAVDPRRFDRQVDRPAQAPLRAAFVGRLVPYKGADMLLEAAAPLVRAGELVLDIIGDGPMAAELKAQIEREQIVAGVAMPGWVEHAKLQDRLVESDVFAFPSVREFGGAVVLEAMALGLTPIVIDYGGPGELVSPGTGVALPMADRAGIVASLRAALQRLTSDPQRARQMGEAGRRRVMQQFTWDAKAKQVMEVYRWVLDKRRDRPDFGMPLPEVGVTPDVEVMVTA